MPDNGCCPEVFAESIKRRPGRCYRAADVAWRESLAVVAAHGKERGSVSGGQLLEILESDLSKPFS
jgi:hypothetical protein